MHWSRNDGGMGKEKDLEGGERNSGKGIVVEVTRPNPHVYWTTDDVLQ